MRAEVRGAHGVAADWLTDTGLAIFLFHGIIPVEADGCRNSSGKHLISARFRAALAGLCRRGEPVTLERALSGDWPPGAFLVTFDDGFRNNLTVAAPILREFDVPAVFYLTTQFVSENQPSWIDTIEQAVDALDQPLDWKLDELQRIRAEVKTDPGIDPYEYANGYLASTGHHFEPDPMLDDKLNWQEAWELDRDPLFTVGGHTHTHRVLGMLPRRPMEREIHTSLCILRHQLGRPITAYSYPEGLEHCYSEQVIATLKTAGITSSPTAIEGVNEPGSDPFHWNRVMLT